MDTNLNNGDQWNNPPSSSSSPLPKSEPVAENLDNQFDDANEMNLNISGSKAEDIDKRPAPGKSNKPNPKELAEMFKNTLDQEKTKSRSGQNQYLYYLIVFVIMAVGFVLFWQLKMQRQIDAIKTELSVTVVPDNTENITPSVSQNITVITPEEFAEVNGKIDIALELGAVTNIAMKVFDDNGVEIGSLIEKNIKLTADKTSLSQSLSITKSPSVSNGYLVVYPADQSINSPVAKTITLNFQTSSVANRLNLTAPLKEQLITGTNIKVVGEMKSFTDNEIGMVIKDDNRKVLIDTKISAPDKKATQDFIKFDQTVELGTISNDIADTGVVEFYDPQAGSTTILLTIPVRFK